MKVFGFPCFGISQIHLCTKEDRYRSSLTVSYTFPVYTGKCGVLFYLCKVLREPRGDEPMAPHFLCLLNTTLGAGGNGGFMIMYMQLENILGMIENRLKQKDIKRFKIGITEDDIMKRFQSGYDEEGYTHISEIANSNKLCFVKQAEKDLIQWALNNPALQGKCENVANGGGCVDNANLVYVVAESNTISQNKMERLLEELPKSLFEDSISAQLG